MRPYKRKKLTTVAEMWTFKQTSLLSYIKFKNFPPKNLFLWNTENVIRKTFSMIILSINNMYWNLYDYKLLQGRYFSCKETALMSKFQTVVSQCIAFYVYIFASIKIMYLQSTHYFCLILYCPAS